MRKYSAWALIALVIILFSFTDPVDAVQAPMFEGENLLDGKNISMRDLEGHVLIIDFWATWCMPCREEIPGFIELYNEYRDQKFAVIGMSLDRTGEPIVKKFINDFGVNYPVVMAVGKIQIDYEQAWGQPIPGIPTNFIVSRSGEIVATHVGFRPRESFEQEILPLLNEPFQVEEVKIISVPVNTVAEGVNYRHKVEATGGDASTLTYSLVTSPAGMSMNPNTGLLTWIPSAEQAGTYLVVVHAMDRNGGRDIQNFTITVAEAINVSPVIASTPVATASESKLYTYDVDAKDADNDRIAYSLVEFPDGMAINASTGLISWTPSAAQLGNHEVVASVTDGRDGSDTQEFTVEVGAIQQPTAVRFGGKFIITLGRIKRSALTQLPEDRRLK